MKKVYWVQYHALVRQLLEYLLENRQKLPAELQPRALSIEVELREANGELYAYDAINPRGRGM